HLNPHPRASVSTATLNFHRVPSTLACLGSNRGLLPLPSPTFIWFALRTGTPSGSSMVRKDANPSEYGGDAVDELSPERIECKTQRRRKPAYPLKLYVCQGT
ncbi:unnamed protein product, partial [Phaeothamnion confervicola]